MKIETGGGHNATPDNLKDFVPSIIIISFFKDEKIVHKLRIRSKRPTVKEIIFYKKISLQLRYKKGIFIS